MRSTAQKGLSQGDDSHSAPLYDCRVAGLENGRLVLPVGVGLASKRLGPDREQSVVDEQTSVTVLDDDQPLTTRSVIVASQDQ